MQQPSNSNPDLSYFNNNSGLDHSRLYTDPTHERTHYNTYDTNNHPTNQRGSFHSARVGNDQILTPKKNESYLAYSTDSAPSQRKDSVSAPNSRSTVGPYARPSISNLPPRDSNSSNSSAALPAVVPAPPANSEFTKRKNWSQHIIDEIQDFMHVLAPNGNLMFSTPSIRELTGWTPEEVIGRPISDFIHADDIEGFTRDFQNSLRFGNDLTLYYRFRMKDDRYIIFEITGHPYYAEENGIQRCKCFFAVGRPYPSKNTAMLDSFLELKIENERLRQELNGMYNEMEEQGDYGTSSSDFASQRGHSPQYDRSYSHPAPPASNPTVKKSGTASGSGSRTHGTSYGVLGIGVTGGSGTKEEHHRNPEKKKKKSRVEEGDFVCRDCGTIDSPEWRKGPDGPKSLCNACGLRYAKLKSKGDKEKAPKDIKPQK